MNRIKKLSDEVLGEYRSKFGEDFAGNKKALNQIYIIRSKSLKNKIAGYITKLVKREIQEEKTKQEQLAAIKLENARNEARMMEEAAADGAGGDDDMDGADAAAPEDEEYAAVPEDPPATEPSGGDDAGAQDDRAAASNV